MRLHDVDLPQPIIDAQKRGKLVLFAGAGVSIDPPSNYLDFGGLADEIGGATLPRRENELIDRYLGRLEQEGRAVHERVKRLLSNPDSRPNHLHQTIVRLFGTANAIRILTTNFDDHSPCIRDCRYGFLGPFSIPSIVAISYENPPEGNCRSYVRPSSMPI